MTDTEKCQYFLQAAPFKVKSQLSSETNFHTKLFPETSQETVLQELGMHSVQEPLQPEEPKQFTKQLQRSDGK